MLYFVTIYPVCSVSRADIAHCPLFHALVAYALSGACHIVPAQSKVTALLQVAGDCCGSGSSLSGQRELPWPILLHREAPKVLSDWCSFGGGYLTYGLTLHYNTL